VKRDVCRVHGTPLVFTLAGTSGHCRFCEREAARDVVTVSAAQFKTLREQVETTDIIRSEER